MPSFIEDKFFLGGPTSLRLFPLRSLGPQIIVPNSPGRISIGGDLLAMFGVSFSFPVIPQSITNNFRGHIWANFGHLSNGLRDSWKRENLSGISFGSGIIFKIFNLARMEANMGWRVITTENGCFRASFTGPSFGIGAEFL